MTCNEQWKRHQWNKPDRNGLVDCKRCRRIKNNPEAREAIRLMKEAKKNEND